jgi:hypothetical protein
MEKIKTFFVLHQFEVFAVLILAVSFLGYKVLHKPKTGVRK